MITVAVRVNVFPFHSIYFFDDLSNHYNRSFLCTKWPHAYSNHSFLSEPQCVQPHVSHRSRFDYASLANIYFYSEFIDQFMNLHLLLPFFIYSDPLNRKEHERILKVVQGDCYIQFFSKERINRKCPWSPISPFRMHSLPAAPPLPPSQHYDPRDWWGRQDLLTTHWWKDQL